MPNRIAGVCPFQFTLTVSKVQARGLPAARPGLSARLGLVDNDSAISILVPRIFTASICAHLVNLGSPGRPLKRLLTDFHLSLLHLGPS